MRTVPCMHIRSLATFMKPIACGMLCAAMLIIPGCAGTRQHISNLSHADKKVVVEAMYQLQQMGSSGHRAIPRLMDLCLHEDPEIRRTAVETIGNMGKKALNAKVVLGKALRDENTDVRRAAVIAIGKYTSMPTSIFPNLIACMGDNDKLVREFSIDVFVELGTPGIGTLIRALGNRNAAVRRSAAEALGRLGPDAVIARSALKKACLDSDTDVCRLADNALKKICLE